MTVRSVALVLLLALLFALGVCGYRAVRDALREPEYIEVWIDCPKGVLMIWWDADAFPPTASQRAASCENIGRLHDEGLTTPP